VGFAAIAAAIKSCALLSSDITVSRTGKPAFRQGFQKFWNSQHSSGRGVVVLQDETSVQSLEVRVRRIRRTEKNPEEEE
jgi:hypothetical protein